MGAICFLDICAISPPSFPSRSVGTNEIVSFQSFLIITSGGFACVAGGYIASKTGSYRVAFSALLLSGLCCLCSPVIFIHFPAMIFPFMLFWGMVVVMDSPQFSSLVANSAPSDYRGTALAIVNCIGFSITILSIQLLTWLFGQVSMLYLFLYLAPGPVLGLLAFYRGRKYSKH